MNASQFLKEVNVCPPGDVVEVGFSGNIENGSSSSGGGDDGGSGADGRRGSGPEELIFKSNVPTMVRSHEISRRIVTNSSNMFLLSSLYLFLSPQFLYS